MIIEMRRLIETMISVFVLWVLVESNGGDMVVRLRWRMNLMMMRVVVVVVVIVWNWWWWTSEVVYDASLHLTTLIESINRTRRSRSRDCVIGKFLRRR